MNVVPRNLPPQVAAATRLRALLGGLCPRCRLGRLFLPARGLRLPRLLEHCSVCGLKFEREEGYFLGAMYISYGLGLVVFLLFGGALWLAGFSLERAALWGLALVLPLSPTLAVVARALWIHFDRAVDPE